MSRFAICSVALGLFLGLAAVDAHAEDVTGTVLVVGSGINTEVVLTGSGDDKGTTICRGDLAKVVRRLVSMTVKVKGEWQLKKNGNKKCIDATEFAVLKMSSGRDAVIGMLSEQNGSYSLTSDAGKVLRLQSVPENLKKMSGQKVILDLKGMGSPAKEEAFAVVTYLAYP